MKKLVSCILIFSITITLFLPSGAFAQQSKELEQLIITAKQKIDVPDNLTKFSYEVYNNDGTNIWNLNWSSKKDNEGYLNISIKQDGTIINYSYYKNSGENPESNKLPKINKGEAQKIAADFIKKVNPKLTNHIALDETNTGSRIETTYSLYYNRIENGVLLKENRVNISIDATEGYVQNYYCNWTDDLVLPLPEKSITKDQAEKAYQKDLGLKIVYDYKTENNKIKTYPVYVQKHDYYYINALTGEKVQLKDDRYGSLYNEKRKSLDSMGSTKLSPEEQNAVNEVSKISSKEDAEKSARASKVLEITADFKVENASLYKDWLPTGNINWNISFSKSDDKDKYQYVYVQINAKTGEIVSFSRNILLTDEKNPKYNKEESKNKVEAFLKEFCSNKFNNSIYDENYTNQFIPMADDNTKELPNQYTFRYIRKVNGIPFVGNWLTATYDAVNDKITSFDSSWFETDFQSLDKVISTDKAYEKLYNDIGYGLQYMLKYSENGSKYGIPKGKPEVYLVYAPNPNKPIRIDAAKGTILNTDGTVFVDKSKIGYTDIDNSTAKSQINILAEYGIGFEGDKFLPSQGIIQKDFLYLLSKAINPYNSYKINSKKDIDKMYNSLIMQGVVKKSEKAPYAKLKNEDSIKFIIRAMKYDKVADLKDIYVCSFADASDIKPGLYGYICIAKGLKIISGDSNYFYPKRNLSRENAAVIIYNFLNR